MTDFEYWTDVELRYDDLDTAGHVNNARYVTYLEQARTKYLADLLEVTLSDIQLVVAHLDIDFLRPIRWGQDVTVGIRVSELGTKSFTMVYEVQADGEPAATAESVQVTVDPHGYETCPVPTSWRERIETHEPHL